MTNPSGTSTICDLYRDLASGRANVTFPDFGASQQHGFRGGCELPRDPRRPVLDGEQLPRTRHSLHPEEHTAWAEGKCTCLFHPDRYTFQHHQVLNTSYLRKSPTVTNFPNRKIDSAYGCGLFPPDRQMVRLIMTGSRILINWSAEGGRSFLHI